MRLISLLYLTINAWAAPLGANYAVSDCGMYGSGEYQDCQDRIAAGESAYLVGHVPDGIPWDSVYLADLPLLTQLHHRYFVVASSEDSRWIVVGNHDEDTDSKPAYLWHDGTFTSAASLPPVNQTGGGGWIFINDQGTIAIGRDNWPVWFSPIIGQIDHEAPSSAKAYLTDANQILFRDAHSWINYLYEPVAPDGISNQPSAPITSTPEPGTFLVVGASIIWIRKFRWFISESHSR